MTARITAFVNPSDALATKIDRAGDTAGDLCGGETPPRLGDAGPRPAVITKDLREVSARDFEGFDAVAHLAELSNDPIGQQDPGLTHEINHGGSVRIAEAARQAGVQRFVYTSSCSVYP